MSALKSDSPTGSLRDDSHDQKTAYKVDSGDQESGVALDTGIGSAAVTDHHAERALCRKFDFRLLPVLALMYLFNALDKGNLGNAKTAKFDIDLGFKDNQYNIILSVFYVPYVIFAPPIVNVITPCYGKKYQ
jgi:hypothetical protein